jgi:hypothetical protein
MSARAAIAIALAVVGMLALGGAWSSATATPGESAEHDNNGNGPPADCSVGNACGNTPPGQSENDKNKGHECDDNHGIGQGNPAHQGCTTTTIHEDTQGCTTNPCEFCVSDCGTTTTIAPNTPTTEAPPSAEVLGLTEEQPAAPPPNAAAPAQQLAFTGATADVLGFLGLALVAFGGAFLLVARKPKQIQAV